MFEKVPTQVSFVELEHAVLEFWEKDGTFEKLRQKNASKPRWSFLDGPITANNPMGVHHAWGRTYKDCFQRYFAMNGRKQRYQNGFDCQGLWVEVEVEKELGFGSKQEIEEYGLEKFVNACKERVRKYSRIQTEESIRLGFWMDWSDSYYTMADENNYMIWSFLKKCHDRGLIYRGKDSMPWCPRCEVGLSDMEMNEGYKEVADTSVIVRYPLRERENEHLLVWTTTPWTLAANVACAVGEDVSYVAVRQDGATFYLAADCLDLMKAKGEVEVLRELTGAEMADWEYDGPFDDLPAVADVAPNHRVVVWDEVSSGEGTGIVHIAPGCGREDFELGRDIGLDVLAPIDEGGNYLEGYGFLTGQNAQSVADDVLAYLRERGVFYRAESYTHNYPHCWRCGTALLFRNVDEWFIDMSWRDEIKAVAKQAKWFPKWGLDLELDWLTNMRDWMISKKRFWGLALPIYDCAECGHFDVIGSKEELKERAVEGWGQFEGQSPHRPWVDGVKIACSHCGQSVSRVADVGNPWLDAGIVPYSTVRYGTDREYWANWIPADLITECFPGQFRNWFYALLAMSTMMENIPPFKMLLGHASVRDENGKEMHKSLGNAIWFSEAADKMGVDVMRWIFAGQNPVNNLNFGYKLGEQVRRKIFITLWNVYAFFCNYARLDEFDAMAPAVPVAERPDIDRWIISNMQLLVKTANANFPEYRLAPVLREAEEFIDLLSNWYVRRNRRRFWRSAAGDDRDKLAAYQTLHEVLTTLCRTLAPIIPFVTETMYRHLVSAQDEEAPGSVHLSDYPQADETLIDEALSAEMNNAAGLVSTALGLRKAEQIRVRQPLRNMIVVSKQGEVARALERFRDLILDELNIKALKLRETDADLVETQLEPDMSRLGPRLQKSAQDLKSALATLDAAKLERRLERGEGIEIELDGETLRLDPEDLNTMHRFAAGYAGTQTAWGSLYLDTTITAELRREGLARDIVRQVQQLRKEMDLNIEDRIHLRYVTEDEETVKAFESWGDYIAGESLSVSVQAGLAEGESKEVKVAGSILRLQVQKA